ncbi:MAG: PaREP1 family protein, partial [Vulcanisaeta sp.]|uniref:PaREP1 family protein n=1 Tax=Vulcanisaeta sp. TaxID=2020871 RepID=UPI003D14516B
MTTIEIPKKPIDEARRRGIDIEALIIDALINQLKLGPADEGEARVEMAINYLSETKQYIERDDAVQASEKLYKAAEEAIKAMAIALRIP